MRRREFMALLGGATAWPLAARAQPQRKVPRIGALMIGTPDAAKPYVDGFAEGLRELGYRQGDNIAVVYRYVEGKPGQLRTAAAELLGTQVDVIVAWGTPAVAAVKEATKTVPVVFVAVGDPVGTGLISSLTRPAGNITGLTNMSAELSSKQLELLREVAPGLTRVAVLRNPTNPVAVPQMRWTKTAAEMLNMNLQVIDARAPTEIEAAFSAAIREKAGAVTVLADPMFLSHREQIAQLAMRNRLPSTFNWRQYVEAGGLMAYGPSLPELWRRAASFVDKILKGGVPARIPVEQPTKFDLVINLKTAKALGLEVPPTLIARAEEVIE